MGESLRFICETPGIPSQPTVFRWLRDYEDFRKQYARAREDQAERYLDEIIEIADNVASDTIHGEDRDMPNSEWIARSRLRVDARKWVMSKLAPKKYGEKIDVTSGDKPLQMTHDEAQTRFAALLATAEANKRAREGQE